MKPVCVLGVCLSFAEENDAVKRGTLIRWEKNREWVSLWCTTVTLQTKWRFVNVFVL